MLKRLQYISQGETHEEQLRNIHEALNAGCDWIQLRHKNANEDALIQLSEKVKQLCRNYHATFIMNDQPVLAKMIDADGVHLGLNDMPITAARAILGNKIIGGTANTYDDVKKRIAEKADYVGVGPLRFTTTKKNLSPVLGYEGYAEIINRMNTEFQSAQLPVIAIGGITVDDIPSLLEAGCYGIALSGAITNAESKTNYVSQLKLALYGTVEHCR